MAALKEAHKVFIVQQLACYRTPTQVCQDVKDEFGIEVVRQQVNNYNPKTTGRIAKKWVAIFDATRRRFLDAVADVPIANRRVRIQELQDLYDRAKSMGRSGNIPLAVQIIETAAKETGDVFTNKRKIDVDARGVLKELLGLTDEEIDALQAGDEK